MCTDSNLLNTFLRFHVSHMFYVKKSSYICHFKRLNLLLLFFYEFICHTVISAEIPDLSLVSWIVILFSVSNINIGSMLMLHISEQRSHRRDIKVEMRVSCFGSWPPLWKAVIIIADRPAFCKGEGGKLGKRKTEGQMQ